LLCASCQDLTFNVDVEPFLRDVSTWYASPCGDTDADGTTDLVVCSWSAGEAAEPRAWIVSGRSLEARFALAAPGAPPRPSVLSAESVTDQDGDGGADLLIAASPMVKLEGQPDMASAWLVAGRTGRVIGLVRPEARAALSETRVAQPETTLCSYVLASDAPSWAASLGQGASDAAAWAVPALADHAAAARARVPGACAAWPAGDLDADHELDWLVLAGASRRWVVVSGHDSRLLRDHTVPAGRLATAAAGTFELGDLDGDGVAERVFGVQVSESEEPNGPRTLRLGLLSVVSPATGHALGTIEHRSFVTGAGARCPLVRLEP
jgi:hypothetical protein